MRILVIEDEPRILAFVSRGLEAEGFMVDAAGDGPDGLRQAVSEDYDLVVLDLLLPRLDGLSVLRELQQRRPQLPVVIVSARGDLETKLRGFGLGACDYVAKPFSFDELLARVRAQLRRGHWGGDGTVVSAGALTLDLARRQARLGEVVAELTRIASSGCCTISCAIRARWSAASACSPRCGATTSTLARMWSTSACGVCGRSSAPRRRSKRCRHGGYRLAPA